MSCLALRRYLVGVGAVVMVVGSFLPWLASGDRRRSSYQLSVSVQRLGLARNGVEQAVLMLWPLVPVVILGATALFWWRPDPYASILLVVAAAYVAAVANLVWASGLSALAGVPVTVVGAVITLVGCVPLHLFRRKRVLADER